VDWADKWLLKFNSGKCKVLHLGKHNNHFDYFMKDGTTIKLLESTKCEKDLGVIVDTELNFQEHIAQVVKRANRMAGLLIRSMSYKSKEIITPLFKALVRPILEYGNAIWNPKLKSLINNVEAVQRHFTKCIQNCHKLSYEERLKYLKLPSLEYRRLRGDLIEMYKITHKFYDPKTTKGLFAECTESITRGHRYKVVRLTTNTSLFQHFYTNRIINMWNSLPREVVEVDSTNAFKNRIDKYFSAVMFSTDFWGDLPNPSCPDLGQNVQRTMPEGLSL
jgi:ribonuclease P/MRP protein subunit RPP40